MGLSFWDIPEEERKLLCSSHSIDRSAWTWTKKLTKQKRNLQVHNPVHRKPRVKRMCAAAGDRKCSFRSRWAKREISCADFFFFYCYRFSSDERPRRHNTSVTHGTLNQISRERVIPLTNYFENLVKKKTAVHLSYACFFPFLHF